MNIALIKSWLLITVGLSLAMASRAGALPAQSKPNIVVFTVDDMDFTSVNAFGNPMAGLTPNIDRLVAEGTNFPNAHVSTPACAPCRQSMMTGKHPHANGSYGFVRIDPDVVSLTDLLREQGYFAGSIGKGGAYGGFEWDAFVDFTPDYGRNPQGYVEAARVMLDKAAQKDGPFYLGINTTDPHRPFAASDQERNYIEYRRRNHPDWDNPPAPVFPAFTTAEDAYVIPYVPDLGPVRRELAEYYTSVRRADHTLGLVLDLLDKRGLLDDTLFVFFSDHGASLPMGKNNLFKHSTQTPLILRWPGHVPGATSRDAPMVSTLDLMPTLLEVANAPTPDDLNGRTLWPLIRGDDQTDRDAVLTTNNFKQPGRIVYPSRAVTTPRYSYIVNFWADGRRKDTENMQGRSMQAIEKAAEQTGREDLEAYVEFARYRRVGDELIREEIYDLSRDPWSRRNLIDDPEYAKVKDDLRKKMEARMKASNDPLLDAFLAGGSFPKWWDDPSQMRARNFKPIH
ncbi:MAG: sulfatase-like hydrolase/transferase [Planctomycetota bacterium]